MTDQTRRLSAEMHEPRLLDEHQRARLNGAKLPDWLRSLVQNALHDLDVADAQIKSAALEIAERSAELAAAQATIARLEKLAWRYPPSEDQSPLSWADAYKTDMDDVKDRVNDMEATIAQQGAVIAAMREALEAVLLATYPPYREASGKTINEVRWPNDVLPEVATMMPRIAQLAAAHDAAVRANERRRVLALEEKLDRISSILNATKPITDATALTNAIGAVLSGQLAAKPEEDNNG